MSLMGGRWVQDCARGPKAVAITEAFRHGQASVVAPFEYTALAWGMGLDWLLWQAVPGAWTLLGGAIIIGSGLYLVRQERAQMVLPP